MPKKFFGSVLATYISPTILLMSIVMFGLFLRLKFTNYFIKLIKFFAPTTFGIYILHIHTIVWIYFLKDRFSFISNISTILIPFVVIFYAIIIFFVCSIIEKFRIYIFKIMNVNNRLKKVSFILNKLIEKILLTFDKL